jgi:hypothetical protein
MHHEIDVRLRFWKLEGLAPEDITRVLGVAPVRVWRKGEPRIPSGERTWPYSAWAWEATPDKRTPFETQCYALLDLLDARREAVKGFRPRCLGAITCALRLQADNGEIPPLLELDARFHALASELNLGFELDLNFCPAQSGQVRPLHLI